MTKMNHNIPIEIPIGYIDLKAVMDHLVPKVGQGCSRFGAYSEGSKGPIAQRSCLQANKVEDGTVPRAFRSPTLRNSS